MKILHVLDHSIPLHSGYTFRTRAILSEQRARGWQTAHLTSTKHGLAAGSFSPEEEVDGLHFYRAPMSASLFRRLPLLDQWGVVSDLARRLAEVVDRERPDILHAHSPALNGLAALRIARHSGIPLVYECRAFWEDAAVDHGTSTEGGLRYRLTRALETHVFRRADAVTTICEGLRKDILARGLESTKVTVIPNAVDPQRFSVERDTDTSLATALGLQGKTVIGFIGSFYAYEGIGLLVEAMARLHQRYPDLRLLLVGGGPQEGQIRQRVTELGLDGRVVFTGRVPHDKVSRYYDLVDVFVYPRLPMRLTELVTPLKPLEAMAQGRLVLASDVGGHRELIESGKTGLLFPANDTHALSAAVDGALEHRGDWPAMCGAARQFVESERSWSKSVGRYKNVYENLLANVRA